MCMHMCVCMCTLSWLENSCDPSTLRVNLNKNSWLLSSFTFSHLFFFWPGGFFLPQNLCTWVLILIIQIVYEIYEKWENLQMQKWKISLHVLLAPVWMCICLAFSPFTLPFPFLSLSLLKALCLKVWNIFFYHFFFSLSYDHSSVLRQKATYHKFNE